ncbi:MAG TPA: hypothetical protein VLM91_23630 [Candidatus Methylomirabilis sp.]|nr:hypothetical protein [Candidatus Methylomirabilis sp.]
MLLLPLNQAAEASLKLGQSRVTLRPKERPGLLQLGLEQALQLQPLAETLLSGHPIKQVFLCPLDLLPPLAYRPQAPHG